MSEKLSRSSKRMLSLSAVLGVLVAIHEGVMASYDFFWPHLLLNLLYFACFLLIFIYARNDSFQSRTLFRSVNFLYALIVIIGAFVFPQRGLPIAAEAAESFLSLLVLAGLVCLDATWRLVPATRKWLMVILAAELVGAGLATWNVLYDGPIRTMFHAALVQVWLRPLLAGSIAACYVARMKQKSVR